MEMLTSAGIAVADVPLMGDALEQAEVLRTRALRKIFTSGSQQIAPLDGVDLRVLRGETISIMGPSGAGKSTLLHILAGLDTPTTGEVYFGGKSLQLFSEAELAKYRNQSVGFVWQRHHLLPDFTAAENVAMPLLVQGKKPPEAFRTATDWLREVGLASRAEQRAGELSGGEQQRVAIARALVSGPAMLLADEPTGDLDEGSAAAIFDLMQNLHESHRLTSILATHNMSLARRTDRILILQGGELAPGTGAVQASAEVLSQPFGVESKFLGERG
jgi:lipoprotein-releasing system ATP-binding protein